MGRFRNTKTGITVSVDDSKDDRFGEGWESADEAGSPKKATAKKAAPAKSD